MTDLIDPRTLRFASLGADGWPQIVLASTHRAERPDDPHDGGCAPRCGTRGSDEPAMLARNADLVPNGSPTPFRPNTEWPCPNTSSVTWDNRSRGVRTTLPTLRGRRVLITGATDGIGRHTVAGLARLGAQVTIVGRDGTRGRAAAAAITRETGTDVEFVAADISLQACVRALAERIGTGPLEIMINNVGGLYLTRWETGDGIEASLAMNALNPLLLATLLQPALRAAPAARVIYITGGMPGRIDLADLQSNGGYTPIRSYSHTKSVMMALDEQARRLRSTGTTVNVAYPGAASTPMTRAMTPQAFPGVLRIL